MPGQRLAGGVVLERLQQQAADLDDRGVAGEQMLGAAVGDRPHGFLDGAILGAEPLHAGIGFAARLQRAIDQIIVVPGCGRRDRCPEYSRCGCRAPPSSGRDRPSVSGRVRAEIDAVEHRVLVVDRRPHMRGVRDRRDDLVERHQHHVHVPHDVAVAALAAGPDHESEIGRHHLVERRHDAAGRLGVAADAGTSGGSRRSRLRAPCSQLHSWTWRVA